MTKLLWFLLISAIYVNPLIAHPNEQLPEKKEKVIVEWNSDACGLFSNLMRAVEWMYCVKENENFGLYVNMDGAYGFKGNTFSALFKPFEDAQITATFNHNLISYQTNDFPRFFPGFSEYPTDGMKHFHNSRRVYQDSRLYKDPDFSIFRKRLHPIVLQYFQPVPELQKKVDIIGKIMNPPIENPNTSPQPNLKIGIHVRGLIHYQYCNKSPAQFLNDVVRDVDRIMESKDPYTTKIFLATLVEPLIQRLSAKYNVVVCNIPRIRDPNADWNLNVYSNPVDGARDAIVDTWCLANCDELWGSSSNMVIFAACLNPDLKIHMLPSLEGYDGN
jgi:hypothetical protein